jgi:hypothetical protein
MEVLRLPLRAPEIWWDSFFQVRRRAPTTVAAGRFPSCYMVVGRTSGGAGDGSIGMLCPGVGYALYQVEHRMQSPGYFGAYTMELRRYSIPPITVARDGP